MLGLLERLDRQKRKAGKYRTGGDETPPYPGSIGATYSQLYPKYLDAPHLVPLFELFERAKHGEPVRACVSYPPRAGKTETLIAGIVDRLQFDPTTRIAYVSYAAKFAEKKSARVRSLARLQGVPIDPTTRSKKDWATGREEGGLWATSTGGQIVGMGFELVVGDDVLSGREDAESLAVRDQAYSMLKADVGTRMEPNGSIILTGTRYHEDDPIGRLVREGWEEINIPAIDAGSSYWPARWTLDRLHEIRTDLGGEDGYDWCSLYMGNPRAQGEAIFRDAHLFESLPPGPARFAIGLDFAYTVRKSSDYSAAVVLAEVGGVYHVVDVLRVKLPEADFRQAVAKLCERYEAQFVVGYVAATEQPNIDLLNAMGLPAIGRRAVADKKTRALPSAAGWNLGRIKVMSGQTWTRDFIREVVGFTGSDRRDDQVDALAGVYDSLHVGESADWGWLGMVRDAAPKAFDFTGMGIQ